MDAKRPRRDAKLPMTVLKTPDELFEKVVGWPWGPPSYYTSRLFGVDVRMAYWDFGPQDAPETLLLTHGEPSWSYLNRKLIGPLLDKGYRVVCFDQVGLGWSDKPAKREDVTYERSVAWNEDLLFNFLELRNITAVLQDWGGLIGLRVAARNSEKYARLVLSNTCLPTDDKDFQRASDGTDYLGAGFYKWKKMAHDGFIAHGKLGFLLKKGSKGPSHGAAHEITEEEAAAYDLPFPTEEHLAAVHVFPELVPTPPDDETGRHQPVGGEANRALWAVFEKWTKPVLLAFSDGDWVLGHCYKLWQDKCPGAAKVKGLTLEGDVGHFSQDGGGEQLVAAIIDLIEGRRNA